MAEPAAAFALDIATGTGELAFELERAGARAVVGVDFCYEMVAAALQKYQAAGRGKGVVFTAGDAMALPFADATFDCIVNGFMLRNVADLSATFNELYRVLKPGGRLVCLDLTPPRGPLRHFFDLYIATFVPLLGVIVGRKYGAYRYLFQSLTIHPNADTLARIMRDAGFAETSYQLTGFGTVAIHLGRQGRRRSTPAPYGVTERVDDARHSLGHGISRAQRRRSAVAVACFPLASRAQSESALAERTVLRCPAESTT